MLIYAFMTINGRNGYCNRYNIILSIFFFFSRMQTADPISYIVISDNKQLQCSMLSHRDCV